MAMRKNISILSTAGTTLAIALVVLLVLSIISITALQTSVFEDKMTNNLADKDLSFQTAETSLVNAEKWILGLILEPIEKSTCDQYPCVRIFNNTLEFPILTNSWWQGNSGTYTVPLNHITEAPRTYLEHYRFVNDNLTIGNGAPTGYHYYRVTSRGVAGGNNTAVTILQTSVMRRY
jgi:type IV pilus assembly protein PilX